MNQPNNDHDLLIQVDTKLGTLIGEMQLMRDGTNTRLSNVEQNKVDKADFIEYKVGVEKAIIEAKSDIYRTIDERSRNRDEQIKTLNEGMTSISTKIDFLNRNIYIILGMGLLLEVLIPIFTKFVFK